MLKKLILRTLIITGFYLRICLEYLIVIALSRMRFFKFSCIVKLKGPSQSLNLRLPNAFWLVFTVLRIVWNLNEIQQHFRFYPFTFKWHQSTCKNEPGRYILCYPKFDLFEFIKAEKGLT